MPNSQNSNQGSRVGGRGSETSLAFHLTQSVAQLKAAYIDNPDLDARILFGHVLNLDRTQLMSQSDRLLTADEIARIHNLIERRAQYEPVARILGEREFWGLSFGLNEATLEPRPDSETLVEVALLKINQRHPRAGRGPSPNLTTRRWMPACADMTDKEQYHLLDLGTGTGCLLLSLLHELPQATGVGVDIAARAIEQAQRNAEQLQLTNRAVFQNGSWFDGIKEKFDLILSNPPYIVRDIIPTLMPDVREHDPMAALDGGADGLDAYCYLIPQLPNFLKPGGLAVFEIGYDQVEPVNALFRAAGATSISIHKDLGGQNRCIAARFD